MSERVKNVTSTGQQPADDEINLLEYFLVVVKHKRMIFFSCVIAGVLSIGLSLMMPNIYSSTARILPPQDDTNNLSSMLGSMGGLASLAGIPTGGGSGYLYAGMLKSRTISDVIIDKFDLERVYRQNYRVKTYEVLMKAVSIVVDSDSGILFITVEDRDPKRAAEMANTYIEELQKLNVEISLSNAGRERLFLEKRLDVVKKDLVEAEDKLKNFQEKNKAIRIDVQANAIIEAIAQFKGELASKEVELGVLLSSQTEQNPQVVVLREAINQIKSQISQLERSPKDRATSDGIFLATSEVPELGVKYARLLRDFKVQEALFELLTKQYEVAKINEAKNTSAIQILDKAMVADKKSKPKRALIVISVTFVVGFLAVIFSFVKEFSQSLSVEDRRLWNEIKQQMKITKKHNV